VAYSGFVKLRRGILEHYQDGKVSAYEFHIYVLIILEADYRTGVWCGSGKKLSALYRMSLRTCQDVLAKLEGKRYIRRFMTFGKHGNYPVLVNKYQCTDSAGNEVYLNAMKSKDWRNPIYDGAPTVHRECADGAPSQEVRTKNEEKTPRKNQRGTHAPEQVRQIEEKQRRLEKEAEARREVYVGAGPSDYMDQIRQLAKAKAL
jgi:hypothetical protein